MPAFDADAWNAQWGALENADALSQWNGTIAGDMKGLAKLERLPNFARTTKIRALMGLGDELRLLGIEIDKAHPILKFLNTALLISTAYYSLYNTYVFAVESHMAREAAMAAAETAEASLEPTGWVRLAIAVSAAATFAATFGVVSHFSSGDWTLPKFDITDAAQRRQAQRIMGDMITMGA